LAGRGWKSGVWYGGCGARVIAAEGHAPLAFIGVHLRF